MHLIPGGPYDEEKMPLSDAAKANILRSYGLDKPLWQQYLLYVGNALRFEFGYSYQSPGETVAQLIGRVWTVSLQLGALTLAGRDSCRAVGSASSRHVTETRGSTTSSRSWRRPESCCPPSWSEFF